MKISEMVEKRVQVEIKLNWGEQPPGTVHYRGYIISFDKEARRIACYLQNLAALDENRRQDRTYRFHSLKLSGVSDIRLADERVEMAFSTDEFYGSRLFSGFKIRGE